ncbi:hypothetical protein GCM10027048_00070 [Hymenobacter coalescens]
MPFTLCHPAAVVPLARPLGLPLSALWIGSLAPDLIYFVQLQATGNIGHTLPGLFTFCLPAGLLVLWLWHRVVKAPAAALLPAWAGRRAAQAANQPFAFGPGRRFGAVVAALLLGALTHDAWDAFTHLDGWVVQHWPLLQREVPFPVFGSMPLCKVGQLASTAGGGVLLAWWAWRWLRRQPAGATAPPLRRRLGWTVALMAGALVLGVGYSRWQAAPLQSYAALRWFLVQSIVASCSALWLGLVAFGLWYRRQHANAGPVEPALAWKSKKNASV